MCTKCTFHNRTPEQRFWSKVDPCRTDGCALWLAYVNPNGYGHFKFNYVWNLAHHFLVGKPPEGLVWDHVKDRGCTHRNCVWPGHLEAVTRLENTRRGEHWNVRKTHCPYGHPYDAPNTILNKGHRYCRACNNIRRRLLHQKQKQGAK